MQYVIDRLLADSGITKVWFDEKGGWSLNPDVKHPIERTRDEVLEYWENLDDNEKAELYGIKLPAAETRTEDDPYEQIKLLEESTTLLQQENEEIKKSYAELESQYKSAQSAIEEKDKTIADLTKKKKSEKSE